MAGGFPVGIAGACALNPLETAGGDGSSVRAAIDVAQNGAIAIRPKPTLHLRIEAIEDFPSSIKSAAISNWSKTEERKEWQNSGSQPPPRRMNAVSF